jgi:hypothetical protein
MLDYHVDVSDNMKTPQSGERKKYEQYLVNPVLVWNDRNDE